MYSHPKYLTHQAFPPPKRRTYWVTNSSTLGRGLWDRAKGVTQTLLTDVVCAISWGQSSPNDGASCTLPRGVDGASHGARARINTGVNWLLTGSINRARDGARFLWLALRKGVPGLGGGGGPLTFRPGARTTPRVSKRIRGSCKYYRYETRRRPQEI